MNDFVSSNLSLDRTLAKNLILKNNFPHDALIYLEKTVWLLGKNLDRSIYEEISEGVWVAKNSTVSPSASITAPCIIGENTNIRHCAYIRGAVIIGDWCVVVNSTEIKNSIIFDRVQIPHYNYIGDSILGYGSHFGAGAITSNVKSDKTFVNITYGNNKIETNRKKLGSIIADGVEIGCNSVLNPGTVIGKNSRIYPLSSVRGYVAPNSIYKNANDISTII